MDLVRPAPHVPNVPIPNVPVPNVHVPNVHVQNVPNMQAPMQYAPLNNIPENPVLDNLNPQLLRMMQALNDNPKKPKFRLKPFDGTGDYRSFKYQFDTTAAAEQWTPAEKQLYLVSLLTGEALNITFARL